MKSFRYMHVLFVLFGLMMTTTITAQNRIYRYTHVGNQQFHKSNAEAASTNYLHVLKVSPNNTRAMFNLANVYLTKGDVKAADSLYNKVAQTDVNKQVRAMAWHNRGYICQTSALHDTQQQQQMLREAIEHYKESLRLNPKDERTRYNLALCQKQLKNDPNKQNNQNKQQQDKQQEQDKQKNQQNSNKNKQQQKQPQSPQEKQQTEQYLNLARQAEKRALEKLKQHQPRQRSLDKNW